MADGDLAIALGQIRDLVNATIGFDALAAETGILKPSLMRMLSSESNPPLWGREATVFAIKPHRRRRPHQQMEAEWLGRLL